MFSLRFIVQLLHIFFFSKKYIFIVVQWQFFTSNHLCYDNTRNDVLHTGVESINLGTYVIETL